MFICRYWHGSQFVLIYEYGMGIYHGEEVHSFVMIDGKIGRLMNCLIKCTRTYEWEHSKEIFLY